MGIKAQVFSVGSKSATLQAACSKTARGKWSNSSRTTTCETVQQRAPWRGNLQYPFSWLEGHVLLLSWGCFWIKRSSDSGSGKNSSTISDTWLTWERSQFEQHFGVAARELISSVAYEGLTQSWLVWVFGKKNKLNFLTWQIQICTKGLHCSMQHDTLRKPKQECWKLAMESYFTTHAQSNLNHSWKELKKDLKRNNLLIKGTVYAKKSRGPTCTCHRWQREDSYYHWKQTTDKRSISVNHTKYCSSELFS